MSRIRWVVIENTPGYLPESEPAEFTNKREAMNHMMWLRRELQDCGYKFIGGSAKDGFMEFMRPRCAHDLGRVVEMMEVYE